MSWSCKTIQRPSYKILQFLWLNNVQGSVECYSDVEYETLKQLFEEGNKKITYPVLDDQGNPPFRSEAEYKPILAVIEEREILREELELHDDGFPINTSPTSKDNEGTDRNTR